MTDNNLLEVTDAHFDKHVINSETPVLVDFWAEWCGPCQALGPIFAELSNEYKEKVKFAKMNVDENPETPKQYGVRGIPTLLLIKGGEVTATKVGALSKKDLRDFIDNQL